MISLARSTIARSIRPLTFSATLIPVRWSPQQVWKKLSQHSIISSYCYSTSAFEKNYKEKLLTEAKKQGFETIEQLLESSKEEIAKKKKDFNTVDPLKELEDYEQRMKMAENRPGLTNSKGPINPDKLSAPFKTFDSFLNLEKIKDLSKQEVEFLWRAKWMNKDNALCAVVPLEVYDKMTKNIKENPVFVLPLPRTIQSTGEVQKNDENRGQAVELHYIQWQFVGPNTTHCIMTSLAEYKLHKDYAKPHTIFQFHSELAKEKKCVFMNGQVEPDTNVSLQDAQLLLLNVQRFYGAMGDTTPVARRRVQLLRDFTKGSSDFTVDNLIDLSQSMEN